MAACSASASPTQAFPYPRHDDDDEVVAGGVVTVEEIRDRRIRPRPLRNDDEFIFGPELLEKVLLVLLRRAVIRLVSERLCW